MAEPDRPNLLVVVLDCVRAWDFPGGADAVPGMGQIESLRRESWEFPRAASVAHWTVPSHSSLFTGLFPWQHGVHAKGRLALPASVPSFASALAGSGYATMSISANGLISPQLGLTAGCARAAWGVSLFNRVSTRRVPPQGSASRARGSAVAEGILRSRLKPLSYWMAVYLARNPGYWDAGTRLVHRLRDPAGPSPRMAPWLEPTLGRWLAETPKEQPLYCFVNLLDAHEPYLSDPADAPHTRRWREYAGTRQDRLGWVSGDWSPTADEFERLRGLYRGTLKLLDERVGRIVEEFRRAGRWENTLMVLTSDHGQAFGEHGALFHITAIDEPEIRVPLLVRPPGGVQGPKTALGWASLIDVAPTMLNAAGVPEAAANLPGTDLRGLFEAPRSAPVLALSDGLVHAARAPPKRKADIDRLLDGASQDDRKVVVDPALGTIRAFDVARDRFESRDLWIDEQADFAPLSELAIDLGRQVLGGPVASLGSDVEDRLRSWGYI
jgi:arylsulfatase A-like enzyme